MIARAFAVVLISSLAATATANQTYLVIIAGLGGEERYRERFHQWSLAMREAALTDAAIPEDNVFYLAEKVELAPELVHAKSTKENVIAIFEKIQTKVRPGDQLYVLLIGHGSFRSEQSRFNLPGPDVTAEEFEAILKPFGGQQIVFVNATSASGNFLPVLSGPNRIVVTATKSGYERNESQFGQYFVEAYSGDGADTDKNERVSVLEAYTYARIRVKGYYDEENMLQTEHSVLDDNGDGEGSHEPSENEGDVAGTAYLMGEAAVAEGFSDVDLAADPDLAKLVEKQRELEGRVVALRQQKESMPEDLYLQELERVLLELAQVTASLEERRQ